MRRHTSKGGRAGRRVGGLTVSVALLLSVCAPVRLYAQSFPNNSGALFLSLPVGAEAVGMGQTAVALGGHGEAAFWNPAGLATMAESEVGLQNGSLAAGSSYALTAYLHSHRIGVIGGAVYLFDYGDLDRTDSTSSTIAHISPRNLEFLASYATQLGSALSIGINYKLVEFRVDCSGDCRDFPNGEGVTHGLDVGGQLTVGPEGALRIGVAVRNIGFKLQVNNRDQADPLPAHLVVGALYRLAFARNSEPGVAADGLDVRLAVDLDSPWGSYGESEMRFGVDVGYQHLVRVRGGYAFGEGLSGPSVGMGISSGSIGVDLARTFLSGSDFVTDNPTFFSFRVAF
jgi:Type IX secretion system protein PorV